MPRTTAIRSEVSEAIPASPAWGPRSRRGIRLAIAEERSSPQATTRMSRLAPSGPSRGISSRPATVAIAEAIVPAVGNSALAVTSCAGATTSGSPADSPASQSRPMPMVMRTAVPRSRPSRPTATISAIPIMTPPRARLATTRTRARFQRSRKTPVNGPSREYGSSSRAKAAATWRRWPDAPGRTARRCRGPPGATRRRPGPSAVWPAGAASWRWPARASARRAPRARRARAGRLLPAAPDRAVRHRGPCFAACPLRVVPVHRRAGCTNAGADPY